MLKVGVIGVGYLGKIHLKILLEINVFELIGFFDIDKETSSIISKQYNVRSYPSGESLMDDCEAVIIVTPTKTHFEIASMAIKKGKHVFLEKPVTPTVDEAKLLMGLEKEAGVKIQVGHVERFNPAFISAIPFINKPQYIEIHRLAQYNPRGVDVSATLDLMIHDLDLLLKIVGSNIKNIQANGSKTISETVDFVNARIEFENGCIANLTANRMSTNNIRNIKVYQEGSIVNIDLLNKITEVTTIKNADRNSKNLVVKSGTKLPDKELTFQHPIILPTNAIKEELLAFHNSITTGTKPVVTIEDAIGVLNLGHTIDEKILHHISK
jgi:predicted dehydrogenase